MTKTFYFIALVWLLGCAGCATTPKHEQLCASTPVVVHETTVQYVPIDATLTAPIEDPGPKLVHGSVVLDALNAAANRLQALYRANQRLACIATVQGRARPVAAPSSCGSYIPQAQPPP